MEGSKAALYQQILASYGGLRTSGLRTRHDRKRLRRKRKSRSKMVGMTLTMMMI